MNAGPSRDTVLGEALACEETRPAAFLPQILGESELQAIGLRAENLLRALAIVEDSRGVEEPEDHAPADLALHRIEAKLDLLTALVARLAHEHEPQDPPRFVRWSARGACLDSDAAAEPGTTGLFRIQPSDSLPEFLTLPATVLARVTDGRGPQLWLRFEPLSESLESALERHLFRVHRRAIAGLRRPR